MPPLRRPFIEAPGTIDESPALVAELMALPRTELPSALLSISTPETMPPMAEQPLELAQYDYSLTRQLADVLPNRSADKTPAVCFLTATSAFPVRFGIDEFSRLAGITLPTEPIMADRNLSGEYFRWRHDAAVAPQDTPAPRVVA